MRARAVLIFSVIFCIATTALTRKSKKLNLSYGERCEIPRNCDRQTKRLLQCKSYMGEENSGRCICREKESWNSVTEQCEKGLKAYKEKCHNPSECDSGKGLATCYGGRGDNGRCVCLPGLTWNGTQCEMGLKSYEETCHYAPECDSEKGLTRCYGGGGDQGGKCLCRWGLTWNGSQCEKPLKSYEEKCHNPSECDSGKGLTTCYGADRDDGGKCVCQSGLTWNGTECECKDRHDDCDKSWEEWQTMEECSKDNEESKQLCSRESYCGEMRMVCRKSCGFC